MQHSGSLGHGFGPQHTPTPQKKTLSLIAIRYTTQAAPKADRGAQGSKGHQAKLWIKI